MTTPPPPLDPTAAAASTPLPQELLMKPGGGVELHCRADGLTLRAAGQETVFSWDQVRELRFERVDRGLPDLVYVGIALPERIVGMGRSLSPRTAPLLQGAVAEEVTGFLERYVPPAKIVRLAWSGPPASVVECTARLEALAANARWLRRAFAAVSAMLLGLLAFTALAFSVNDAVKLAILTGPLLGLNAILWGLYEWGGVVARQELREHQSRLAPDPCPDPHA